MDKETKEAIERNTTQINGHNIFGSKCVYCGCTSSDAKIKECLGISKEKEIINITT